jgi:hypothetical protein
MLKDTTLFATTVKKMNPATKPVKIGDGKLAIDGNTALAWNKEIFIFTGSSGQKKLPAQNAKTKTSPELTGQNN